MFASMKAKEKRKVRAYKIADKPYEKAMKRASRNKQHLANIIEAFVTDYSEGANGDYNNIKPKP